MRRFGKFGEVDFADIRVDAYGVDNIERPAEAALLDEALKRQVPRISVRKAAKAAGISEGWWRQITKGVQSRGTGALPVVAPPETIAKMALAVSVGADELRAAGREDAAAVLLALQAEPTAVDLTALSDEELAAEFLRRMKRARSVSADDTQRDGLSELEARVTEFSVSVEDADHREQGRL